MTAADPEAERTAAARRIQSSSTAAGGPEEAEEPVVMVVVAPTGPKKVGRRRRSMVVPAFRHPLWLWADFACSKAGSVVAFAEALQAPRLGSGPSRAQRDAIR